VPDLHGQLIYTDEQMFTYRQQFEKHFARCAARVIDASGGGARKQGASVMPFAQALAQFARAPIPAEKFAYRRPWRRWDPARLAPARQCVEQRLTEVRELHEVVKETLVLVREMLGLIEEQEKLNQKMLRLDELRAIVKRRVDTYRLVMFVAQAAELYRFRQDRALKADRIAGKERQRRQLIRDVGYISELDRGCERLLKMLADCLVCFDALSTPS
jgi:hypothetical protein